MASLKQKPDESLTAYGERAFRLRQMLDASDEPYLVQRFRKGIRDKAIRRLLASHKSGDKEVTIQELNTQIINICDDDRDSSSSESESESAASSDDSSGSDDEASSSKKAKQKKKDKAAKKAAKKSKGDLGLKKLKEYEERLKKIEEVTGQVESFHVGNFQQGSGGYQGKQGSSGGYRQYNQGGFGRGYQQYGYQSGQQGDSRPPIMCFNCGKDGHMARFCREFRGNSQRGQWGQASGPDLANQAPAQTNTTTPAQNANIQGPRITEVPDVAAIKLLSSAMGGVKVVKELVKYVDPAEVYVGERRRHSEMDSGGQGDTIRVRKRPALAPPEPLREPNAGEPSRAPPQPVVDSESDIEMEERPKPVQKKQTKTPRQPKPPRKIRMMMGHAGFDVLAEFREMPVNNLKWGALLDIAPALRRIVGTGLLLERLAKKPKGKQAMAAPAEAAVVNAKFKKDLEEEPCLNFFTKAVIRAGNREFEVERALIDAGSVVNLASQNVLEAMGAPLYPAFDLTIRTATSALTTIKYFTEVDVSVAGVTAKIRVFAIPREFNLSYGLLLSRRWMRQVKIRGNYELDKYYIKDEKDKYREVPRNTAAQVNTVELPRIRRTYSESGAESSLDDETRQELELAEASSEPGDDEILREVIGQATDVMRRQMRVDMSDSSEEDYDAGNESDF